jgi:hypothetical protein
MLSDEEIAALETGTRTTGEDEDNEVIVVGDSTYLLAKAKMLIRDFLFLRVFITNILLSPWDHGIGPKPLLKQKKLVDNLRMAASIFYDMLKLHHPSIPRISHV